MASTFFGLTIGTSGLFASKTGLNTTAHNISNIETEGYTRQSVSQTADDAIRTHNSYGMLGTGVKVNSIEQSRSMYYDEKYRSTSAENGLYGERYYFMKEVESYLNEIQLEGFTTSFDNMYNSLQELSKDASSLTVRTQVTNYAQSLCEYFNSLYTNLQSIQDECNYEVKNQVQKINSIADQIATLNKQINTVEVGGENANDLRDQRNLLVDQLSEIINVQVSERELGTEGLKAFVVKIDGNTLVDTYETNHLTCVPREDKRNLCDLDGLYDIQWTNGDTLQPSSGTMAGSLKALFEVRDGNNNEDLRGAADEILFGETQLRITKTNINNVADLNIPTQGALKIGNGYYSYSSFEVTADDEGNYEYVFQLNEPARRNYDQDVTVTVGSHVDYKGIPYYMAQMNQFVRTFAENFNNVHRQGQSLDMDTDISFFTGYNIVTGQEYALGTFDNTVNTDVTLITSDTLEESTSYYMLTAQNFRVRSVVMDNPSMIATTTNLVDGVSGNNIVEKLIALKSDVNMFKQGDPASFLRTLVAEVGIDTKASKDTSKSQSDILKSVANQRLSVSGVDSDEEAMYLVRYQEAYSLSAKVISVMQEIYDKLINETGV
ncbi:MAG: flagellar hook-associated protein FlgK [Lachnospiraceae bacterium]|nr:flagellar hook-associated protein FlgK [Lachnospiraceae bacterium]